MATSLAVLVPVLFVLGTQMGHDPSLVRSPLLGKSAPSLDLARIGSLGRVSSSDQRGRVYVVNFWASWCVPCRQETPALRSFYDRWQPRGVELIGILYADTTANAVAFHNEFGGSWPIVDDPGQRVAIDYGVRGVPETFVIDERGVVMAKLVGAVGPTTLDGVIQQIQSGGQPVSTRNSRYRSSPSG